MIKDLLGTGNMNVNHLSRLLRSVFCFLGFCLGLVVTLSFISGDEQGRVNLLYFLILFVFLPVCGILISVLALFLPWGKGVVGWLLELPFWPQQWQRQMNAIPRRSIRRAVLFYLSQILAVSLGLGCLVAFFFVLLVNDVSFVWRSTFLQAADLLPLLSLLAKPWLYWQTAQPSLELLQLSQDYRLGSQGSNALVLGQWWKYALAAQVTYNLIPRVLMLCIAQFVFWNSQRPEQTLGSNKLDEKLSRNSMPVAGKMAPVVRALQGPYVLLNWAAAPDPVIDQVRALLGQPVAVENRSADSASEVSSVFTPDTKTVVLVKSWEPPLGELADCLQQRPSPGWVMPLDWHESEVNEVRELHLAEWRRFSGTIEGWAVLLPVTK